MAIVVAPTHIHSTAGSESNDTSSRRELNSLEEFAALIHDVVDEPAS